MEGSKTRGKFTVKIDQSKKRCFQAACESNKSSARSRERSLVIRNTGYA